MVWFWILVVALVVIYAALLVYTHKRKLQLQMRHRPWCFKKRIRRDSAEEKMVNKTGS